MAVRPQLLLNLTTAGHELFVHYLYWLTRVIDRCCCCCCWGGCEIGVVVMIRLQIRYVELRYVTIVVSYTHHLTHDPRVCRRKCIYANSTLLSYRPSPSHSRLTISPCEFRSLRGNKFTHSVHRTTTCWIQISQRLFILLLLILPSKIIHRCCPRRLPVRSAML